VLIRASTHSVRLFMLSYPRRRGPAVLALLTAALVAACSDQTAVDTTGGSDRRSDFLPQPTTPTIDVYAKLNGVPAIGYVVTAVNSQTGPFRQNQALAMALTGPDGFARIDNLPLGSYCVHVRPLSSLNDANGNGTLVAPTVVYEPNESHGEPAMIYTGGVSSTIMTNAAYVEHCIQNPILHLTSSSTTATAFVPLLPAVQSAAIQTQYLDPEGNPAQAGGWVIIDKSGEIPWFPPALAAQGIKPGLLISTGGSDANGNVFVGGLTPGVPVVLESGIATTPAFGQLTSTLFALAPSYGQATNLGAIVLEPLLCVLQRDAEPTGDNTGSIDFLGPIKAGFRADFGPPLTFRNELAFFYTQTGTGDGKLHLRFVGSKEVNVTASYTWDGTTGSLGKVTGSTSIQFAVGFVPVAGGGVRVTWSVTNLPENLSVAEYFLSTNGDQAPNPERSTVQRAYTSIPIPTVCTGGQSNDDQWWLPM
jgi:hypothetical protein